MPVPSMLYLHSVGLDEGLANLVQVLNMCQGLDDAGLDVTLALPEIGLGENETGRLIEEELGTRAGFKLTSYRRGPAWLRPQTLRSYAGLHRSRRRWRSFDYIFVRHYAFLGLALSLGGRVVFESHDDRLYAGNGLVNRLMVRSTVRRSRHPRLALFLTISQALADRWAKQNVPEDKLLTLHDGVSRNALSYEISPDEARRELGLPLDRSIVVYAGSLKADRKPERLWRLARAFPDTLFVVVGGESEQVDGYRAAALAAGASNIRWVGRVPHSHVRRYLAAGEVLLMLWSWDVDTIHVCSPLKVFEYMAAGRTIVGEAFPTIGEVLVHEQTALLASPGDFDGLRACLGRALSGKGLEHLGEHAHKEAGRYTWDRRCQQILSALSGAGDAAFPGTAHTV